MRNLNSPLHREVNAEGAVLHILALLVHTHLGVIVLTQEALEVPLVVNIPVVKHYYRGVTLNSFWEYTAVINKFSAALYTVSLNVCVVVIATVFLKQNGSLKVSLHDVHFVIIFEPCA